MHRDDAKEGYINYQLISWSEKQKLKPAEISHGNKSATL